MTPPQHKFYLRRWAAVVRANGWRMVKGRLAENAVGRESSRAAAPASPHHQAVFAAAEQLAALQHRALTADDLRHACHVVALGRDKSSKDFSNRDFDRLLVYWGDERTITGLLLEPLDLAADIHRANPDLKTRARHQHFLQHECLGGYVMSECERIFHTKEWEALPTHQLIQLSAHLRARPNCLKSTVAAASVPSVALVPDMDPDNRPF